MTVFAHSQTTNKLVNEAANDSARVSGQDRKKLPALGTNQIAGFGGFRPLASLEKKINICYSLAGRSVLGETVSQGLEYSDRGHSLTRYGPTLAFE